MFKALAQLTVFAGVLFFILYLQLPHTSKRTLAWTTIRYRTQSKTLPEVRGKCPGLADTVKPALVVSRVAADGDPSWLDSLSEKYHLCVYNVDAPADSGSTSLQTPANRGHEAMTYLTFLVDNYEQIPAAGVVFVHGSRFAWHNDSPDYDNAALLAALNVSAALEPYGYHNLRCDWSAGTCNPSSAPPQGSLETSMRAVTEPFNSRVASDAALPGALAALFAGDHAAGNDDQSKGKPEQVRLGRSDAVRAQCCAQFVVSPESIWQHSRDEYGALRQWLLDDSAVGGAPRDDLVAGRVLSYLWHILFIRHDGARGSRTPQDHLDLSELNTQACPAASECYCRLYGRCDLECTGPDRCPGQYTVPPGYRLPADWAATHT